MNPEYINNQLNKCVFAKLDNYDSSTGVYHIKKYSKPRYDPGKCYIVKLSKAIINNTSNILSSNWNNGQAPRHEYYKIYVNQLVGAMLKVDGTAFDINTHTDLIDLFSGYLPLDELEQIKEI